MTDNELEKPIGTKEQSKLSAGSVVVKKITIDPAKEGSKAKLVTFHCLHPDKSELIKLSNIKIKKVQGNNETLKKDTLWWNLDDDGNIRKNSSVSEVMKFYKKDNLKSFENSTITTETDANGYLVIKCY